MYMSPYGAHVSRDMLYSGNLASWAMTHQTRTRGGYRGRRRAYNVTNQEGSGDYTETVRLGMKTARMGGNTFQKHRAQRVAVRLAHHPRCFFTRMVSGNRRAGWQGKRTSRIEVGGLRWKWVRRGHGKPTRRQSALKNAATTTGAT